MNTREFAGYSIVRNLAGGGMTRLFVALDSAQNRVVLRYLLENWARKWRFRKRFFHGAKVLSKLSHPHIVKLVKTGYEGRIPYMVLEFVESRTLRDLILYREPLMTQNVLSLMRQMAENILVRPDGHIVVIDFDLAIKRKRRPAHIKELPGTPSYIAPEALTHHVVDERSDIYSLGVTFYEMLTYHKPFEGDKIEQVRAAQIDPNIPPTRPRQYNPAVPLAMESLVLKCLAKQPDDRYPSLSLVIRDLEAIL
jgi:serine/threonine protein kinase